MAQFHLPKSPTLLCLWRLKVNLGSQILVALRIKELKKPCFFSHPDQYKDDICTVMLLLNQVRTTPSDSQLFMEKEWGTHLTTFAQGVASTFPIYSPLQKRAEKVTKKLEFLIEFCIRRNNSHEIKKGEVSANVKRTLRIIKHRNSFHREVVGWFTCRFWSHSWMK